MSRPRGSIRYDLAIFLFILVVSLMWLGEGLAKRSILRVAAGAWGLLVVASVPGLHLLSRWKPSIGDAVGDWVSEGVMLTFGAYLILPLLGMLYSAFLRPFVELGFSEGVKIALFFALLAVLLGAFIWALKFPFFARLAVSALVFGVLFGFAAFLTPLFLPVMSLTEGKLYSTLGAEAALALAVSAWQFRRSGRPGGPQP